MLVRGTTPHGEERLARARRLRRAVYVLFGAFLLLVLIAVPLFISRFAQVIAPDDPAFIRRVANADAVWTFRPAPVAEHLFGDASVPFDLSFGLSTLHQHGQVFVYHPRQMDGDLEWVMVIPRRRPQRLFDAALRRNFRLEGELGLSLAYHLDRHRLIAASDATRLELFRTALAGAGEVPKVEEPVVHEDPLLQPQRRVHFKGPWGLLPQRLLATIKKLSSFDPDPSTEVSLYFPHLDRRMNWGLITIYGNVESDEEGERVMRQLGRKPAPSDDRSMGTITGFVVEIIGVLLDGTQRDGSAEVKVLLSRTY